MLAKTLWVYMQVCAYYKYFHNAFLFPTPWEKLKKIWSILAVGLEWIVISIWDKTGLFVSSLQPSPCTPCMLKCTHIHPKVSCGINPGLPARWLWAKKESPPEFQTHKTSRASSRNETRPQSCQRYRYWEVDVTTWCGEPGFWGSQPALNTLRNHNFFLKKDLWGRFKKSLTSLSFLRSAGFQKIKERCVHGLLVTKSLGSSLYRGPS